MKGIRLTAALLSSILCCGPLVSCGDDDDPKKPIEVPELPTPAYESASAKYEISTPGSEWSSIELTASGEYIIIENSNSYDYWSMSKVPVLKGAAHAGGLIVPRSVKSRAWYNNIIHGRYTKVSDNEFNLIGFGTIVIEGGQSDAISLSITTSGGQPVTVTALKASQDPSSKLTDAVCRTWNIDDLGLRIKINKDMVFEGRRPRGEFNTLMSEANAAMLDYMRSHYPEYYDDDDEYDDELDDLDFNAKSITFTKSGTYLVIYSNDILAVSTWHWENESEGRLYYSWDYNVGMGYNNGRSGTALVSFEGQDLVIRESGATVEDGVRLAVETAYYCSESK